MTDLISNDRPRERRSAVPVWLRLARVFQKISARSERLFRDHGLNTAQFDLITNIGARGGLSQQELANALLVTKGNVSQLVGKLEQRGLVARRQEGRSNCLSLTAEGRETYDLVVPLQEATLARYFAPLSAEEQLELLRMLRKIDRALVG